MNTLPNTADSALAELEPFRQMPHLLEAEQALLGAMLVNNAAVEHVQGYLRAEHFYEPVHGDIYAHIVRNFDQGQVATPITLKPFFEADPRLEEAGGADYLARLAGSAVTIINAKDYGRIIHDLALRRELIGIGEDMVNDAFEQDPKVNANQLVEHSEAALYQLAETGDRDGEAKSFADAMAMAIEKVEIARKAGGGLSGRTTGLMALDKRLGGFHESDLIILAGRPGMGKTALATNIAFETAKRFLKDTSEGIAPNETPGAQVGFFSLEMAADQLAARILAQQAAINSEDFRKGSLNEEQFRRLARTAQELNQLPFYIDDTPALTIAGLRTRARRLKRKHGLSMIVVDYLQLLQGSGSRAQENRVQEISEITRGLKTLAKSLDVPVLALSQLSRAVEQREDKRPQLADLRESGSIEQDADMVLFIYREEYYHALKEPEMGTEKHAAWREKGERVRDRAEVLIAKQRHGATGTAELRFFKDMTSFKDPADDEHLPDQFR
ncbi:MAG: replicative DNA helicase [Pseudomonadota bacterium]